MRATGIIRKIDDLGRIVLPKAIRRILHIRVGDPLEIFADREGVVILKKYSPIVELEAFVNEYAKTLSKVIDHGILFTDREMIVASAGGINKEIIGKSILRQMEDVIQERELIIAVKGDKQFDEISINGLEEYGSRLICPIFSEGDVIGAIAFLGKDEKKRMGKKEIALAQCAANLIGRHISQ